MDPDLGQPVGGVLTPAPDLGGIDVDKVRAAAHCTLFRQVDCASGSREIDQDGAVAVSQAAYQCTTCIFVDAGADSVDVLCQFGPVRVALDVDGFAEDRASRCFD